MDEIDLKILSIIQQDGRVCNSDVARQVELAPSATLERVRKLETRGVIQSYEARLDPAALGKGLLAFIFVRTDDRWGVQKAGTKLTEIPEVLEVHNVAGEDCYLVKVRVADTTALAKLLRDKFGEFITRSTIVLETLKETTRLPLPVKQERKSKRNP